MGAPESAHRLRASEAHRQARQSRQQKAGADSSAPPRIGQRGKSLGSFSPLTLSFFVCVSDSAPGRGAAGGVGGVDRHHGGPLGGARQLRDTGRRHRRRAQVPHSCGGSERGLRPGVRECADRSQGGISCMGQMTPRPRLRMFVRPSLALHKLTSPGGSL